MNFSFCLREIHIISQQSAFSHRCLKKKERKKNKQKNKTKHITNQGNKFDVKQRGLLACTPKIYYTDRLHPIHQVLYNTLDVS